jgi:hypothetical protein
MADLRYTEYRFWSFLHDGPAARIAVYDERGREHARIEPVGKAWAKRRDEVIAEIERDLRAGA